MRITRSTLRRLIAEESARLLREAAFPEEIEAQYGRGRGGEEEEEERGTRMLHVTYHGGAYEGGEGFSNVHYIVTDYDANPMGEEAEDVTAEITGGEDLSALEDALALRDWLLSHTEVGYVVNEEMHDPETDENDTADEYLVYLDGVISAEEAEAFGDKGGEMHRRAVDRAEHGDLDEADKKGRVSPRKALGRYLASHGADDEAVFRAIDRAIDRAHEETGEMPTSEDITFNLSDEILDAIPEDDSDKWHSMLEDVLADEFDADAFADAESYRKDIEDTERDLSHPSRFLEEGDDDSDPDDSFMDYDPEEIPDMDDQYDPEYYEGLDDEEDDEDFMGYETGDDDVPYGAADVALRMGRGHRTDEGEDLSESIDMLSAGIGAIVGIAALYAAGPLSRVAYNILDELSYQQQQAARAAASKEAGSKLAAAIENLSHDKDLIALFKELEDLQKSEEKGASAKISKKSKEITAYIKDKRKDMSFGSGDEQDVRRGVSKRLKKGDDDKGDKLDEGRWAQLAGILKG